MKPQEVVEFANMLEENFGDRLESMTPDDIAGLVLEFGALVRDLDLSNNTDNLLFISMNLATIYLANLIKEKNAQLDTVPKEGCGKCCNPDT